jgi:replicative DNA helicase
LELYGRGEPADAVTVSAELTRRGEVSRLGGSPYLHTLISTVPTAANAGYYAEIVAERAVLRRLVRAGTRIVQLGYGAAHGRASDVAEVIDRAQAEIYQVTGDRTARDLVQLAGLLGAAPEDLESIQGRGEGLTGVATGLADLDAITHGLRPGQLVVLAGRPAQGKSVLGLGVARACALHAGRTAALFSLEMSTSELTLRLLAAEADVPLEAMQAGRMTDEHWARVGVALERMSEANLFIDDSPGLTLTEIRAKCRRLKQRHGLALVVVDYLQLLARDLDVPVIAVSQLNRNPEARQDKRPQLGDLRESGAIEADADLVVLVHRPGEYDPTDRLGECDLIVAKHRNGRTGTVSVAFRRTTVEFRDMGRADHYSLGPPNGWPR